MDARPDVKDVPSDGEKPEPIDPHGWTDEEKLAWQFEPGERHLTLPARIGDDRFVTAGWSGTVYAVNADGNVAWTFEADDKIDGAAAVAGSTVYLATYGGTLHAIGVDDGAEQWSFDVGGVVDASPTVAPDGTIFVATQNKEIVAVDSDGSEAGRLELPDYPTTSISLVKRSDATELFVGTKDGKVNCLTAELDEQQMQSAGVKSFPTGEMTPAEQGGVVAGNAKGALYFVNAECTVEWEKFPSWADVMGGAWMTDGSIALSIVDRKIYWFDLSGNKVQSKSPPVRATLINAPLALEGGGLLGAANSLVHIDKDGNQTTELRHELSAGPVPIPGTKGIVATTEHGTLVRYDRSDQTNVAESFWAQHHANAQRTGAVDATK